MYSVYPCKRYGLDTEACPANEKSAKRILKNSVYFSLKTHFMVIVHIDDMCESTERDRGPDPASWL